MKPPVYVTLTEPEMRIAEAIAALRQEHAEKRGLKDAHGFTGDPLAAHLVGAYAEAAVAQWLNVHWTGTVGTLDAGGDVGPVEVRGTPHLIGRLRLHLSDKPDRPYVLVVGKPPTLHLAGWCWGSFGQQSRWWYDPGTGRPAFWVPQRALTDMEVRPWRDQPGPVNCNHAAPRVVMHSR